MTDEMNLAPDFKATDLKILVKKRSGDVIAAYTSEYKGYKNFQIRVLYRNGDDLWRPSKEGFSVPEADKAKLITNIAALAKQLVG
jgi:hypothetical protein